MSECGVGAPRRLDLIFRLALIPVNCRFKSQFKVLRAWHGLVTSLPISLRRTDVQQPDWHCIDADSALRRLDTSAGGLTSQEAQRRLEKLGPNKIPETQHRTLLVMVAGQFADFMIIVLLAAALISGFIGEPPDTIAILVIIMLNAVIGTVQEYRAERAVAALREMATPEAQALRDGQSVSLAAQDLVPGDVVVLEAGNIVPADLRLLETEEIEADESALTGESQAVSKQLAPLDSPELPLGDRSNMAYKSSLITRGRGTGVVVATGLQTEIGHIAELLGHETSVKTPLQQRLARFGRYLAAAVLAICAVVFVAGLLQGQPAMLMLLTAISLAVAAIPEALPAVVAISLALGARKLIGHNALVRNLPAVETLGSVTYICSDKTGTLTQNKMTAELFVAAGQQNPVLPGHAEGGHWRDMGIALALNNDVMEINDTPSGEPTELALYTAAQQSGYDKATLEGELSVSASFPLVASVGP